MESFADTEVQKIQFNSQELLAVLVASASILSLSGERYQDDTFREIYIPSDLVILTFGVPLLFASAYENTLIPGVLAYQLYSSLTYVLAFCASPGWVFFLHLIVLCMSGIKFWETTEGLRTILRETQEKEKEDEEDPPKFQYAGSILTVWGLLVALRSSFRMELHFENLGVIQSAVDATQLLVGIIWILGGIQLYRYENTQLGLCLLVQLSAFIYGSLLILLIQYCVMEQATDSNIQAAAVLGVMAVSALLPLERFFAHASSLRKVNDEPKHLEG